MSSIMHLERERELRRQAVESYNLQAQRQVARESMLTGTIGGVCLCLFAAAVAAMVWPW